MTSTPPPSCLCRRCGSKVDPAALHCPHCDGPGPGPGSAWLRRSRRVTIVAMGVVLGALGLSITLLLVASWIGGDDAESAAYVVAMVVTGPAFLLMVPLLLVVAALEYAGNRAYRGSPIVASWDVHLDGQVHVVSVPASLSSPEQVWVDGARIPLAWTPTGEWSARAALVCGNLNGMISRGNNVVDFLTSAVGASYPVPRSTLQVRGGTVEAMPVSGGERRS
jgi:hypothetical protein